MANVYLGNLEPEIDHFLLVAALKDFKKPDDKIAGLIRDGDLQRVVRGHYVLGQKYQKPFSKLVLANRIWGPSYISRESALSFYGAIPEEVKTVTSMTTGRSRIVKTPQATFEYQHLPFSTYAVGLTQKAARENTNIFIANPEKALADLLVRRKSISSIDDVAAFLSGIRLDMEFFKSLSLARMIQIEQAYRTPPLKYLIQYRSLYDQ